jgi:hypothetical protein
VTQLSSFFFSIADGSSTAKMVFPCQAFGKSFSGDRKNRKNGRDWQQQQQPLNTDKR